MYDLSVAADMVICLTLSQIRDQQTSAALGLPPRIRGEDCDVPILEPSDIAETRDVPDTEVFGRQHMQHIVYSVMMLDLARLCMIQSAAMRPMLIIFSSVNAIVSTVYPPVQGPHIGHSRAYLQDWLNRWESSLPAELKLENATSRDSLFLVGMLHMSYKYVRVQEGSDED